jgi:hypothetical protein
MAKLKRGEKTKAARDYLAAHPTASPKEIVAGLAGQGMKIKLGLANSIKYSKRGKKRGRRDKAPAVHAAARHSSNGAVTVEQLIEVKKVADSLGGLEQIRAALDALEQLR